MAKITIPTSLWASGAKLSSYPFRDPGPGGHYDSYVYGLALVNSDEEVEVDDFFAQLTTGHNTSVMHGKLKSISPQYTDESLQQLDELPRYAGYYQRHEVGNAFLGFNPTYSYEIVNHYQPEYTCRYGERFTSGDGKGTPGTLIYRQYSCSLNRTRPNNDDEHRELVNFVEVFWPNDFKPGKTYYCPARRGRINRTVKGSQFGVSMGELFEECEALATTTTVAFNVMYQISGLVLDMEYLPNPAWFGLGELQWLKRGVGQPPDRVMTGMQDAFLQAADQFPKAADNNLSNLVDALKLAYAICTGDLSKAIPRSLPDFWMFWRYSYSTTSADVKQAMEYACRKLISYFKPLRFHGTSTISGAAFGVDDIVCRVGFDVVLNSLNFGAMLNHYDYVYGVEITPYTIWDFIPFSFVADWFTGFGDKLALEDQIRHLENDYIITNCVWSLKYTRTRPYGITQHYSRWYQGPPSLENYVWSPDAGAKTTTWLKRSGDAFAMSCNMLL